MTLDVLLLLVIAALFSKIKIGALYLGTLGALLVGMAGGYFKIFVPKVFIDAGILVLIFVIGVQAGPKFLRIFKKDGLRILAVSSGAILISTTFGILLKPFLPMSFEMFIGSMAGGFSSAAAYAALIDSLDSTHPTEIILGYSASYPLSNILVLLFVPFIINLQKKQLSYDDTKWAQEEPKALEKSAFRITNEKLIGKTIAEIEPIKNLSVNLTRIISDSKEQTFNPNYKFSLNDILVGVGKPSALSGLGMILGEELKEFNHPSQYVITQETFITSFSIAGKTIKELNIRSDYGVVITRIRRDGIEYLPRADFVLEFGDSITVVGTPEVVEKLNQKFNPDKTRLNESQIIPMLLGLAFGVILGKIPVSIYGSNPIQLGATGGVFITSLILGYIRGLGTIRLYLPASAANILKDLGLLFFIVGTGTLAGADIKQLITPSGLNACILGTLVSIILLTSTYYLCKLFKFDSFESIGAVCGNLNASSALPQSGSRFLREVSSLFYASFYPVSLIIKIIVVQLFLLLR